MAINWTNLITNLAGFTVIAGFLWKGLKVAERYVAERTASTIESQSKALAQQERIAVLESIVDMISVRQDQRDKFLQKWTKGEFEKALQEDNEYYLDEDEVYHIRRDIPNLQKKAMQRYKKIHTDFTPP
ncbi:hypothetical protein QUA41_30765 [Microcoleus sp. Pol11C1]|uniref:hypothetical protein n=1 Tax=unclassified Microcoleus TaxID=2642155 RepID=UPI002FD626E0